MKKQLAQIGRKIRRQIGKDYIFFPALTGPAFMHTDHGQRDWRT